MPEFRSTPSIDRRLKFADHGESIEFALFSADGERLLTVLNTEKAVVWDAQDGAMLQVLSPVSCLGRPGMGRIQSAALDARGRLAVLGLNDGSARLIATQIGTELARLHVGLPQYPPSRDDGQRAMWDVADERPAGAEAVCFSGDGQLIAVGHSRRTVSVWEATGPQLLATLSPRLDDDVAAAGLWAHDEPISAVSFSRDNRYLFAGSDDGPVCVWDWKAGEIVFRASEYAARIVDLSVAADSVRWSTTHGTVWEAADDGPPRLVLDTGQYWDATAFSPSGSELLCRVHGTDIERWSLEGRREHLATTEDAKSWADDFTAIGYGRTDAEFYHLGKWSSSLVFHHPGGAIEIPRPAIHNVLLSAEHGLLVIDGWQGKLEIWSFPHGEKIHEIACPDRLTAMAVSRDGRFIACGTEDEDSPSPTNAIRVFRIADGQQVHKFDSHENRIVGLAFGPQDEWLISTSLDRSARTWNVTGGPSRATVQKFGEDFQCDFVNTLSDGRVLLLFRDGVEVWDGLQHRLLKISTRISPWCRVAVSPDERHLFLTSEYHVEQWSLENGSLARTFRPDTDHPLCLPIDEEFRQAHKFPLVQVWRCEGENFLQQRNPYFFARRSQQMACLNLAADGRTMILPSAEGAVVIDVGKETDVARTLAFRGRLCGSWTAGGAAKIVNAEGVLSFWENVT